MPTPDSASRRRTEDRITGNDHVMGGIFRDCPESPAIELQSCSDDVDSRACLRPNALRSLGCFRM